MSSDNVNAIPPYSTQVPRVPGYYWLRVGDIEDIVEVWHDPGHPSPEVTLFIHRCGSGESGEVASLPGARWAGPIPPPHH